MEIGWLCIKTLVALISNCSSPDFACRRVDFAPSLESTVGLCRDLFEVSISFVFLWHTLLYQNYIQMDIKACISHRTIERIQ